MISGRIRPALNHIISQDQTGFMKGRNISTNIRKVLDLLDICKRDNYAGVLLNCDFLKCFDHVAFTCIENSLSYLRFGKFVIDWIKVLYKDFTINIQNNGHFSESINVKRSIHQGGCCSAELFTICAETLAILLRTSDVDGIYIKEFIYLLNQFADDTSVASPFDQENINKCLQIFEYFRQNSGFTLNYDKTQLYRIGSLRDSDSKCYTEYPIQWTNKPIDVLGVVVTHRDNLLSLNYNVVIDKMKSVYQAWSTRSLTLIGKVCVINTLIASLCNYKLMVLPSIPEDMLKQIERDMRNFIWSGKKSKNFFENSTTSNKTGRTWTCINP